MAGPFLIFPYGDKTLKMKNRTLAIHPKNTISFAIDAKIKGCRSLSSNIMYCDFFSGKVIFDVFCDS